ncbi:small ribosomal subunit protein mS22-like isoform X3 [Branchiostoma floridae x Branchiostoma belcheri]
MSFYIYHSNASFRRVTRILSGCRRCVRSWLDSRRCSPSLSTRGVRLCSSSSDPKPTPPDFFDPAVQSILVQITGVDLEKVFHQVRAKVDPPTYKLMTEDQLKKAFGETVQRASEKLQMPPVLGERAPIDPTPIAENPELEGLDTSNFVFTDISQNIPDRERFIVVREQDGILRRATWEERDRLLQVYFPKEGRRIRPPPLFQEDHMDIVLEADRHVDLLDLCCIQFEPDSPDFIRIHQRVYEDVFHEKKYGLLRSTRHFGGLTWYLTRNRKVDDLLVDMLQLDLADDAVQLVRLYCMLHPDSQSAAQITQNNPQGLDIVKTFAKYDAVKGGVVELAVQAYQAGQTGAEQADTS